MEQASAPTSQSNNENHRCVFELLTVLYGNPEEQSQEARENVVEVMAAWNEEVVRPHTRHTSLETWTNSTFEAQEVEQNPSPDMEKAEIGKGNDSEAEGQSEHPEKS